MAVVTIKASPPKVRRLTVAHAAAFDLLCLLHQEQSERPWWKRLLGIDDQSDAIADLLRELSGEMFGGWVFDPKTLNEIWADINRDMFLALRATTTEYDWLPPEEDK